MRLLKAPSSLTLNTSNDGASLLRLSSALAVGDGILSWGAELPATWVRADGVYRIFLLAKKLRLAFAWLVALCIPLGSQSSGSWELQRPAKPARLTSLGAEIGVSLRPWAQSRHQAPCEVCSFSVELPNVELDLLGGCLYHSLQAEEISSLCAVTRAVVVQLIEPNLGWVSASFEKTPRLSPAAA